MTSTGSSQALELLRAHTDEIRGVQARYGASNPRLFGSVAGPNTDIDILVDLPEVGHGSRLARLSGIRLELEQILGTCVDVACEGLLKDGVSEAAREQAVALSD